MMSAILFLMPILLFCGVQSKPNSKWLLVETEPVYNKESRQDHKEPSKPNGTHIDYVDGGVKFCILLQDGQVMPMFTEDEWREIMSDQGGLSTGVMDKLKIIKKDFMSSSLLTEDEIKCFVGLKRSGEGGDADYNILRLINEVKCRMK